MTMADSAYQLQTALLVRLLPHVAPEPCFALKGGTAINLFVRDLPRLSVDIDLVYVPISARAEALAGMDAALRRIAAAIRATHPALSIQLSMLHETQWIDKLFINEGQVRVKIEVNHVFRGTVHQPRMMAVSAAVEDALGFARTQLVSFEDLFAGKLVAALDRQHPRDLFDVQLLLDHEGISPALFTTFLVYLAGHNRPLSEVLFPLRRNLRPEYDSEFAGMTRLAVALVALEETRERLITCIHQRLGDQERQFLLSFKRRTPDWSLLGAPHAEHLPAIRWKLDNLAKMPAEKHAKALSRLESLLSNL